MKEPVHVVYDGECPFCTAYVKMLRLKQAVGEVVLLNAREPHPIVEEMIAAGVDFDQGMAVRADGSVFTGDEAIQWLSLMTTPSATLNGAFAWLLRDRRRARLLYPALRSGRNLALRLLGRSKFSRRKAA